MDREPEESVERGSSDIFHDLGLPDADEMLSKAKLARAIGLVIKERKLTQVQVAQITGIDQPWISQLMNGRISGFTSDRLMRILTKLGQDVIILIREKPISESRAAFVSVESVNGL